MRVKASLPQTKRERSHCLLTLRTSKKQQSSGLLSKNNNMRRRFHQLRSRLKKGFHRQKLRPLINVTKLHHYNKSGSYWKWSFRTRTLLSQRI